MARTLDDLALKKNERAALAELRERLQERFGDRLAKLTLFGSKARGDGDEESDLDVAVVIRGYESSWRIDEVDQMTNGICLDNSVPMHTVRFSEAEYEDCLRRERPITTVIESEGVML